MQKNTLIRPLVVVFDELVRSSKYSVGRTVINAKIYCVPDTKDCFEFIDVVGVRAAERVDGLVLVSYDSYVSRVKMLEQFELRSVGVLEFVYDDVVVDSQCVRAVPVYVCENNFV